MNCSWLKKIMIAGPAFFFAACGDTYTVIDEQVIVPGKNHIEDTIMDDPLQHIRFSRLRKPVTFGLKYVFKVPEENQDKETYIAVRGRVRSNLALSNAVIAVVAHCDNEQLTWMVMPVRIHITDTNTWCPFNDSVYFSPRLSGKKYNNISAVAHLVGDKERFDMDALHVTVRQKR